MLRLSYPQRMMEILPVDFHIFLSDSPTFPPSLPPSLSSISSAPAIIDKTVSMIRQKEPTQSILDFVTKSCDNKTTQVISPPYLILNFTRPVSFIFIFKIFSYFNSLDWPLCLCNFGIWQQKLLSFFRCDWPQSSLSFSTSWGLCQWGCYESQKITCRFFHFLFFRFLLNYSRYSCNFSTLSERSGLVLLRIWFT